MNTREREQVCIDYFINGNFDLNEMPAKMFAVYYWPPNQRQRDSCETISFTRMTDPVEINKTFDCDIFDETDDVTSVQAEYINSAGKKTRLLYYGDDAVKNMYRACDKPISKYIFIKKNENYTLGINCSARGRGMLFAKSLPTSSEVQAVVKDIEIMTGREGSPDCPLKP